MPLQILIASYLEPELVERIRQCGPEVEVHYHPELLAPPRYAADHTGAFFERTDTMRHNEQFDAIIVCRGRGSREGYRC